MQVCMCVVAVIVGGVGRAGRGWRVAIDCRFNGRGGEGAGQMCSCVCCQ